MADESIIEVRDLVVELKGNRILNGVTLDVYRGEILGFVGASGAGKSVLTRTILGLLPKLQGRIDVFGVNLDEAGEMQRQEIERRWGIPVMFGVEPNCVLADRAVPGPGRRGGAHRQVVRGRGRRGRRERLHRPR